MTKILTRDQILRAPDLQQEEVPVPEWGGSVLVRGLTGMERDQFEASVTQQRGRDYQINLINIRAKLVALSVIGEDGKRLFSDADVEALGRKSARALQRVWDRARDLSGLSDQDVEDLAKNSEPGQSAEPISG